MFLFIKINIIDFRKDNIFMVVRLLNCYFSWVWENEFCFLVIMMFCVIVELFFF